MSSGCKECIQPDSFLPERTGRMKRISEPYSGSYSNREKGGLALLPKKWMSRRLVKQSSFGRVSRANNVTCFTAGYSMSIRASIAWCFHTQHVPECNNCIQIRSLFPGTHRTWSKPVNVTLLSAENEVCAKPRATQSIKARAPCVLPHTSKQCPWSSRIPVDPYSIVIA